MIVLKRYLGPGNTLFFILLLHGLKNILRESLLKLFVREIDAKLLKAIVLERFEAKNIQHVDVHAFLALGTKNRLVDLVDQPVEQPTVQLLRHGITPINSVVHLLDESARE